MAKNPANIELENDLALKISRRKFLNFSEFVSWLDRKTEFRWSKKHLQELALDLKERLHITFNLYE